MKEAFWQRTWWLSKGGLFSDPFVSICPKFAGTTSYGSCNEEHGCKSDLEMWNVGLYRLIGWWSLAFQEAWSTQSLANSNIQMNWTPWKCDILGFSLSWQNMERSYGKLNFWVWFPTPKGGLKWLGTWAFFLTSFVTFGNGCGFTNATSPCLW